MCVENKNRTAHPNSLVSGRKVNRTYKWVFDGTVILDPDEQHFFPTRLSHPFFFLVYYHTQSPIGAYTMIMYTLRLRAIDSFRFLRLWRHGLSSLLRSFIYTHTHSHQALSLVCPITVSFVLFLSPLRCFIFSSFFIYKQRWSGISGMQSGRVRFSLSLLSSITFTAFPFRSRFPV